MKTKAYYDLIKSHRNHERCMIFLDEFGFGKESRGPFMFSPLTPCHSYRDLFILVFEMIDEGI
jgi:hypothetical protein